jgi:DNA-binding LacI/PurR family transcriptional regulator
VPTPVTIYDVAAEAGVSISTVSLALNSPTRVSDATRQRVLRAADALGFVPKADAVSRARRGVGRIGVVAPLTSYASFARRLNGVLRAVQGQPLEVVVFDQQSAAATALPLLASLPLTRRLDGLVVMGLPLEESVATRLVSLELPTVLVDLRHPSAVTGGSRSSERPSSRICTCRRRSSGSPATEPAYWRPATPCPTTRSA